MAITIVQSNTGSTSGTASSLGVTFSTRPTAGNIIIAVLGTLISPDSATPISSITITGGTFAKDVNGRHTGPNNPPAGAVDIWSTGALTGTPGTTVTANFSGALRAEMKIFEVSGLDATPLDKTATNTDDVSGGGGS